jgi:hypothetical protein
LPINLICQNEATAATITIITTAVAITVAATISITATVVVVDCYVFLAPPPLDFDGAVAGGVAHDPINKHHR